MMVGIIFDDRVYEVQFLDKLITIDGLPYVLPTEISSVKDTMKFALFEIQYNPKHRIGAR
jgi:hypothetical protein